MSNAIDQRIVEMQFDNKQFEQGVETTMGTLDKLEKKLQLDNAAKGFDAIDAAANNVDLTKLSSAVESIADRFTMLGSVVAGVHNAISNAVTGITNQMMGLVKDLTITPVTTGMQEYETQINSIQTIMSNTRDALTAEGLDEAGRLERVTSALDELNTYADKTIYNFTEMTRNIGTFTAAGVSLDTATQSIKGIANLAAVSGSTSVQASSAMYQLSQAISSGTVKLQDWNSVLTAGMGGTLFQKALQRTAKRMNITIEDTVTETNSAGKKITKTVQKDVDTIIAEAGSFRESLSEGWLTSDVLTATLNQFAYDFESMAKEAGYTGDALQEGIELMKKETEAELLSQGYTIDEAKEIIALAEDATNAATKVKTFTQLFDTMKESAQSGWTQTWEYIIGDFNEAQELLTDISEFFGGIIEASATARNTLIKGWHDAGGRAELINSFWDIVYAIQNVVTSVKEAFREVFPQITVKQLAKATLRIGEMAEAIREFTENSEEMGKIKRIASGLANALGLVWDIIKAIGGSVMDALPKALELGSPLMDLLARIGDKIVEFRQFVHSSGAIEKFANVIADAVSVIINAVVGFVHGIQWVYANGWSGIKELLSQRFGEFAGWFDSVANAFKSNPVIKAISSFFEKIKNAISSVRLYFGKAVQDAGDVSLWQKILAVLTAAKDAVVGFVSNLIASLPSFDEIVEMCRERIAALGEEIQNSGGIFPYLQSLIGRFGEYLTGLWERFTAFLQELSQSDSPAGTFARALLSIIDKIKNAKTTFTEFVEAIKNAGGISGAWNLIKDRVTEWLSGISESLMTELKGLPEKIKEYIASLGSFGEELVAYFDDFDSSLVGGTLQKFLDGVGGSIGTFLESGLGKILGGIGVGWLGKSAVSWIQDLFSGGGIGLVGTIADKVSDLVSKPLEESMGESLETVGDTLAETSTTVASKLNVSGLALALVEIAAAVLIFAEALKVLDQLDPERISDSIKAIGALLAMAVSAALVLAQINIVSAGSLIMASTGVILLAAAMLILAEVVRQLSEIQPDRLEQGLKALAAVMVELVIFMNATKFAGVGLSKGLGLLMLGFAIKQFADTVVTLGDLPAAKAQRGVKQLGTVLLELWAFMLLTRNTNFGFLKGMGLLVLAASMKIFAGIVAELGSMKNGQAKQGVKYLGAILLELAVFGRLMNRADFGIVKVTGLVLLAAAIEILTDVVTKLAALYNINPAALATSIQDLGIVMTYLAVFSRLTARAKINPTIGVGYILLATAVLILAEVVEKLAALNRIDTEAVTKGIDELGWIFDKLGWFMMWNGKNKLDISTAVGYILLVKAVLMLAEVVEKLAALNRIDTDAVTKGIDELGWIFDKLGWFLLWHHKRKLNIPTTVGYILLAKAVLALVEIVEKLAALNRIDTEAVTKGVDELGWIFDKLGWFMMWNGKNKLDISTAVGYILLAESMLIFADVVEKLAATAKLDYDAAHAGVQLMGEMFTQLTWLMFFTKKAKFSFGQGAAFIMLGLTLKIIVDTMAGLAQLDANGAYRATQTLTTLIGELNKVMLFSLVNRFSPKTGLGFLIFGAAVRLMVDSIIVASHDMDPSKAYASFQLITWLMDKLALMLAYSAISSTNAGRGFGVLLTAGSLLVMVQAVSNLVRDVPDMEVATKAVNVLDYMMTQIGKLGIWMRFSGLTTDKGVGILALAASLKLLVNLVKEIAQLDASEANIGLNGLQDIMSRLLNFMWWSKFAGFKASKGLGIASLALGLKLMVSTIAELGTMDTDVMKAGVDALSAVMVRLLMFSWVVKKIDIKAGAGIALAALGGAIWIFAKTLGVLGSMDAAALATSMWAMTKLMLMLAVFTKVIDEVDFKISTGVSLILLAVSMGLFFSVISQMAEVDLSSLKQGITAMGLILAIVSGFMIVMKYADFDWMTGLGVLLMGGSMMLFAQAMQTLGNMELQDLAQSVVALGALITGLYFFLKEAGKLEGVGLKQMFGLVVMGAAMLLFVKSIASLGELDTESLVQGVVGLGAVIAEFWLLMQATKKLKFSSFLKGGGAVALMLLALKGFGEVIQYAEGIEPSSLLAFVGSFAIAILSMAAAVALMGTMSFPMALSGLASLALVVTGITALMAALGAAEKEYGLSEYVLEFGNIAEAIGNAIGRFLGGLGSGFMTGLDLPGMATELSNFMINMQPFLTMVSTVNGAALTGIGYLALIMAAISGVEFINAFYALFMGESPVTSFMDDLGLLADGLNDFVDKLSGFTEDNQAKLNIAASCAASLVLLLNAIPWKSPSWVEAIVGAPAVSEFATLAVTLADGLNSYAQHIAGFSTTVSQADVTNSTAAAAGLASLAGALPSTGGWAQKILGTKDLGAFGDDIGTFGDGLVKYAAAITGFSTNITEADITNSTGAARGLVALANDLPGEDGWVQKILGTKDLGDFSRDIDRFATNIKSYAEKITGFSTKVTQKDIENSTDAAQGLVDLANALPGEGGWVQKILGTKDLGDFGSDIETFATSLMNYATSVAGFGDKKTVSKTALERAATTAEGLVDLANALPESNGWIQGILGVKDLGDFGDDLEPFAEGLVKYAEKIKGIGDTATGTDTKRAADVASGLATLAQTIPADGGWLQAILGAQNLSSFGTQCTNFGTGIANFASSIANIELSNTETVLSVAKSILEFMSGLQTEGGFFQNWNEFWGGSKDITNLSAKVAQFGTDFLTFKSGIVGAAGAKSNFETAKEILQSFIALAEEIKGNDIDTWDLEDAAHALSTSFVGSANQALTQSTESLITTVTGMGNQLGSVKGRAYQAFKTAGKCLGYGIGNGIAATAQTISTQAVRAAQGAINAIAITWQIHSPSRVGKAMGMNFDLGIAGGISEYSQVIESESQAVGQNAVDAARKMLVGTDGSIFDYMDTTPTIRPVLDLSNIQSGIGQMNGMFASDPTLNGKAFSSLNVRGNVGRLQFDGERIAGGQTDKDIIGEIRSLYTKLGELGEAVSNMQLVLDTGTLVGATSAAMDAQLGVLAMRRGRGN